MAYEPPLADHHINVQFIWNQRLLLFCFYRVYAVFGIFPLLCCYFGIHHTSVSVQDLRIALFIIFISILGIGGCVWALFLTGIPMNMGIIAENAILTVNQFLTTYRTTSDIDKSINFAISLSIRQKLMTAVGVKLALHH